MTTATRSPAEAAAQSQPGGADAIPLAGQLRLNLSALGIDPKAPDFVVEVRSRTDSVVAGLAKMQEWMDGGARLGWCIDPYGRRVCVYRAGREVEVLEYPETLSGEDVLIGFVFEVKRLVFERYAELAGRGE